jgi:hypothetical protein
VAGPGILVVAPLLPVPELLVGQEVDACEHFTFSRCGEEIVATGHFSRERALEIGGRIAIGRHSGIVRSIEPLLG